MVLKGRYVWHRSCSLQRFSEFLARKVQHLSAVPHVHESPLYGHSLFSRCFGCTALDRNEAIIIWAESTHSLTHSVTHPTSYFVSITCADGKIRAAEYCEYSLRICTSVSLHASARKRWYRTLICTTLMAMTPCQLEHVTPHAVP